MRESTKRINDRLGEEQQIENPTFQGARGTYVSCSLKRNIPAAVIAKSTKHKDLNNVLNYAEADESMLSIASTSIAVPSVGEKRAGNPS